ncbi:hypothetical protein FS815_25565 [Agrobacterium vitis]|uniref:hypothetical protein n=1 Tax=Allorhizobium ampelinum TaxID=3025782 RepID=UPI001F43BCF5|nr:hypothetical protein [Allorhizobium ampelinum]MCF1450160.1 hypothetical protein [Allorhizobium ampelinum]
MFERQDELFYGNAERRDTGAGFFGGLLGYVLLAVFIVELVRNGVQFCFELAVNFVMSVEAWLHSFLA